jgi:hypothetical protein
LLSKHQDHVCINTGNYAALRFKAPQPIQFLKSENLHIFAILPPPRNAQWQSTGSKKMEMYLEEHAAMDANMWAIHISTEGGIAR